MQIWEVMKEPLARITEAVVVGTVLYLARLGSRIAKLEMILNSQAGTDNQIVDHEKRLSMLEAVVKKFDELAPTLRDTAIEVKTLLGVAMKRLDILENHSFHLGSKLNT